MRNPSRAVVEQNIMARILGCLFDRKKSAIICPDDRLDTGTQAKSCSMARVNVYQILLVNV